MGEIRDPETDQQLPIPNNSTPIADLVCQDLQERKAMGTRKYGTPLQAHNGRSALLDAYGEVLDLAQYLKQRLVEEEHPPAGYCIHCGRALPRMEGFIDAGPLCHPDDVNLPDCYQLVTVYHELLGSRRNR